jgi:hypothetical protein
VAWESAILFDPSRVALLDHLHDLSLRHFLACEGILKKPKLHSFLGRQVTPHTVLKDRHSLA